MTRVRLSVDVDPELRRRVKVAAASKDQSVKEWIEHVIRRKLERELERTWMESDLSRRGEFELRPSYPIALITGFWTAGEISEKRKTLPKNPQNYVFPRRKKPLQVRAR
ncbi:MAG: hypothetical protein QOI57_870 [Rubrobacteraceae bacterium]|jgi:hypothetical protein|nr:hypothetical protein [Rubrobacteraceae bacterium]